MDEQITYYEDQELTPAQIQARAARQERLKQEAIARTIARADRAKRWVVDVDATLAKLIALKKVPANWAAGRTAANLSYMIKAVCIAHSIDAIGVTGKPVDCNTAVRRPYK